MHWLNGVGIEQKKEKTINVQQQWKLRKLSDFKLSSQQVWMFFFLFSFGCCWFCSHVDSPLRSEYLKQSEERRRSANNIIGLVRCIIWLLFAFLFVYRVQITNIFNIINYYKEKTHISLFCAVAETFWYLRCFDFTLYRANRVESSLRIEIPYYTIHIETWNDDTTERAEACV